MNRRWLAWGALVFAVTLLLNLPAAVILKRLPWSPGWQPQAVSGTLWQGRMAALGPLGPLAWQLRPWAGQAQLEAGFQRRNWRLTLHGWPWAWRAQFGPQQALGMAATATDLSLDGILQGALTLEGAGSRCRSSSGELIGEDIGLLAPWVMPLGTLHVRLDCGETLHVRGELHLAGEHHIALDAEPAVRRLDLQGQLEAGAAATPLLLQAGWLQDGQRQFSRRLTW